MGKDVVGDIYMLCRAQLARAVSRIVPPQEIEDIVQETYVRYCRFESKGEVRQPKALMMKIARNLALDHIKKAEVRLCDALPDEEDGAIAESLANSPLSQVVSDQEFAQFCEAVRLLPQQCRKAFVLKKVYGYTQREIAREMNLSENTVEKHVAKGLRLCAEMLMQRNKVDSTNSEPARGGL